MRASRDGARVEKTARNHCDLVRLDDLTIRELDLSFWVLSPERGTDLTTG